MPSSHPDAFAKEKKPGLAPAPQDVQTYFSELAERLRGSLHGGEIFTAWLQGEHSDFCRFNAARIRQAGSVRQLLVVFRLIDGRRSVEAQLTLSGARSEDEARLKQVLNALREQIREIPEDPYLLYATAVQSTEHIEPSQLGDHRETVADIMTASKSNDMVGVYAAGAIYRGFANSLGQHNWYESHSFNFDWSLYLQADKAVKSGYAGLAWRDEEFATKLRLAREQLSVLEKAPRTLKPGRYRVYLAPQAVTEVADMLTAWGGFSLKAHKTKQAPLVKMVDEGYRLAPEVSILEHTAGGIAPNFNQSGFTKPAAVTLVERGEYKAWLVSPRSAQEYQVATNGANEGEDPQSFELAAGELSRERVLAELGTGIFINNLWYLNFSDRPACRVTGMTRFASFWVEHGQIVAPLNVMRFDESVYHMLGDKLVGLTAERELLLSSSTYGQRATTSQHLPGVLVDDFSLTL